MLAGSCLCGAIAFKADSVGPINFCNCRNCRKASGTAFAANASVQKGAFRWTRGEALLRDYESSPGKIRRFCSRCGSPMSAERPNNPQAPVRIRLGSLDTPIIDPEFVGHIWRAEAADWFDPKKSMPEWSEFAPA
jgi:hypothetical protein